MRFSLREGPPPPPPDQPFWLTYRGEGVASVPGVGLFSRHTRAEVSARLAERYRDQADWEVAEKI